jgi:hypothetical protein
MYVRTPGCDRLNDLFFFSFRLLRLASRSLETKLALCDRGQTRLEQPKQPAHHRTKS